MRKFVEKMDEETTIITYKTNFLKSFNDIISFIKLIKNNSKYEVDEDIELMDLDNSSDDGNESFFYSLEKDSILEIEEEWNSVNISAICFNVSDKETNFNICLKIYKDEFDLEIIYMNDYESLLLHFENDFNLLEE